MLTTPTFPSNSALASQFNPRRMPVCAAAVSEACPVSAPAEGTRSLYDVLRTRRDASRTEIKTAYRTLAKLYHPDAAASAAAGGREFIEIRNAYATLSDPEARAAYDFNLEVSSQRRRRTAGFPGSFNPTRKWETDQCW